MRHFMLHAGGMQADALQIATAVKSDSSVLHDR
jgi:hypothetical protein